MVEHRGHVFPGRYGHSATYDQVTKSVYIVGGYAKIKQSYLIVNDLLIFNVETEIW